MCDCGGAYRRHVAYVRLWSVTGGATWRVCAVVRSLRPYRRHVARVSVVPPACLWCHVAYVSVARAAPPGEVLSTYGTAVVVVYGIRYLYSCAALTCSTALTLYGLLHV